jgi:hypothetical protein
VSRATKRRGGRSRSRSAAESQQQRSSARARGISVAAVAAAVGLLVSLTSIVDWIQERIDPPAPAVIDTRLLDVQLRNEREPLADYLRDTSQSLEGLSAVERRERGLVFAVEVRLEGAVGKQFPLLWTMRALDRGGELPEWLYRQEAVTFEPEGLTHARTWPIWIPYPPQPGRYRLDVALLDERRQPVDERSSPDFRLATIPALR